MSTVLNHIRSSLDHSRDVVVWMEVDNQTYGRPPLKVDSGVTTEEIVVNGRTRGHVSVGLNKGRNLSHEDEHFMKEVAGLVGRQVEANDHEKQLKQSVERHRKRARNLWKEMWNRTEALANETSYLEGILRSSDDMIITTDLETRIVEFNPGAEKILGYTAEEMQGRRITDIWENAEERMRILDQVMAQGAVRNYDTRLRSKSGEAREISLTLSLLKDEEGRTLGTVGVSKDITEEKAIIRELERLNQNYRKTMGFINHESKNSLIVIAGFVRRLLDTETEPARREQLQIVYHHSKFLEAMTRDFLVMAQLEEGELRAQRRLINDFYEEVILPAMLGLKERYPDSFETYDTSMGGVGPVQVMGDPGLLEIVYRNLFGNALKYRSPGGKISYGLSEQSEQYIFNVWNEGPGVLPDEVEKIFEKFYRVEDETTREKRGTGLGLYNIRQIIEAHGGRIWCEAEPGHWINFLFTLPKE
jgi:PAS domain S-box-containing protein